jgi:hypothetical protein
MIIEMLAVALAFRDLSREKACTIVNYSLKRNHQAAMPHKKNEGKIKPSKSG